MKESPFCSNSARPVPIIREASLRTNSFRSGDLCRCLFLRWCLRLRVSLGIGGNSVCFGIDRTVVPRDGGRRDVGRRPSSRSDVEEVVGVGPAGVSDLRCATWPLHKLWSPSAEMDLAGSVLESGRFLRLVLGSQMWKWVPVKAGKRVRYRMYRVDT